MRKNLCWFHVIAMIMCAVFLASFVNVTDVNAMTFSGGKDQVGYFSYKPKTVSIRTDSNESASFMYTGRELFLKDKTGKIVLDFPCTFIGINFSDYDVKAIHATNPKKTFWIISSISGNGRTMGIWIVGQMNNGKFVKYKQPNSFPNVGKPHAFTIEPSGDVLKVTARMEYWPSGAQYGYQRKFVTDYQTELFWDEKADWFGENRVI